MVSGELELQDILQRPLYINDQRVGVIKGERNHPNRDRLQTVRVMVDPDVAETFMRKPATYAPVHKELLKGIDKDGHVQVSKSFRELQRRWRRTVRIQEALYAPEELLDRGVCDADEIEIGYITGLFKVKRTFKLMKITLNRRTASRYEINNELALPVAMIQRSRDFADDLVLSKRFGKIIQSTIFQQYNDKTGPVIPSED